ncbi:MAG: HlyD family efflux transporter periplasmic adaptor subunit [Planctomycetaceae bacterium]|nr:HlyD family efflux transporter periplasmic adaptor subunit [Planctomycetaceae bacterium]
MSSRIFVPCLLAVLLFIVATPEQSSTQGKGKRPGGDAGSEPKASASAPAGTLEPGMSKAVTLELKAYGGKLVFESSVKNGEQVKAGSVIATLSAPELAQEIEAAMQTCERSQKICEAQKIDLSNMMASQNMKKRKAQLQLESLDRDLKNYETFERKAIIERAEIGLEGLAANIAEQEEEIAQLEKLYKNNELAKESEQLVLNRSRLRLELAKRRQKLEVQDHKKLLETDLPRRDKKLPLDLEDAKLEVEQMDASFASSRFKLEAEILKNEAALRQAVEQLEKLRADEANLSVKAPCDGAVLLGAPGSGDGLNIPHKSGDTIKSGTTLATIVNLGTLAATIQVPVSEIINYQPAKTIKLTCDGLDLDVDALITGRAITANNGKVAIRVEVDNASGELFAGLSVKLPAKDEDNILPNPDTPDAPNTPEKE